MYRIPTDGMAILEAAERTFEEARRYYRITAAAYHLVYPTRPIRRVFGIKSPEAPWQLTDEDWEDLESIPIVE